MSRKNSESQKEIRRKEAAIRQAVWSKLSVEQQISELVCRPGNCKKQIARLEKKLIKSKEI